MHIMHHDETNGRVGKHIFDAIHGCMSDVDGDNDGTAFGDGQDSDEHVEGAIKHDTDFFIHLHTAEVKS